MRKYSKRMEVFDSSHTLTFCANGKNRECYHLAPDCSFNIDAAPRYAMGSMACAWKGSYTTCAVKLFPACLAQPDTRARTGMAAEPP